MNRRGTLTLPKAIRQGLDEGTLLEAVRREDGVIELRPQTTVDASQSWFWTERWQKMEREADADIAAGQFRVFDDVESFLADLDAPATEALPQLRGPTSPPGPSALTSGHPGARGRTSPPTRRGDM